MVTALQGYGGISRMQRGVMLGIVIWQMGFWPGPGCTAVAQVMHFDPSKLDPAVEAKVQAALAKIKGSPGDISAVEALLGVAPSVAETVGTNVVHSSNDPVRGLALKWSQHLQPAEVLVACLEKGSNTAVHWALRQIAWRKGSEGFDKETVARLMPGIESALVKAAPATRAQAVRTMMVCLPRKDLKGFLKGLLKEQPDEVIAAAVEEYSNILRVQDPEVDAIVTKWLKESDEPLLLRASCTYWWLVKSRSKPSVTDEDVAAFERLAGHRETRVRDSVPWAISDVATPDLPRMVAIILRLTRDTDTRVGGNATRALRNANTPEVNVRLRELFEIHQPENVRAAAMEVLGIFGKDNLPLILSAVKADKEISVRQKAVYALRQIGTPEAGRGLEEALKDPDEGVGREARMQFDWFRKEHPEWK